MIFIPYLVILIAH